MGLPGNCSMGNVLNHESRTFRLQLLENFMMLLLLIGQQDGRMHTREMAEEQPGVVSSE